MYKLQLIKSDLLSDYVAHAGELQTAFDALETFRLYTSEAALFSCKIEGEASKVDDLYDAYLFAQQHKLNTENLRKAHQLLSKNIIEPSKQGELRTHNMFVAKDDGRIEYVAVSPFELKTEMDKWYKDLSVLLKLKLTYEEVFYFAAYLHLTFVKIHPWNDGNGRSARLIEKWFIAQHLGGKAWFLQSEKNYYTHHALYYSNLRKLGLEYPELDYSQALPFLTMLPSSF